MMIVRFKGNFDASMIGYARIWHRLLSFMSYGYMEESRIHRAKKRLRLRRPRLAYPVEAGTERII